MEHKFSENAFPTNEFGEHGFYHPDRGYWQAISWPADGILESYPEGTVQVPIKPGDGYEWVDGEWVAE